MSHNNPPVRNAVIAALREHGPMTRHALAECLDWPLGRVHSTVANARRLRPEQVFRVVGYQRVLEGKGKDASIYAAEPGPDMPRPKAGQYQRNRATRRRYRERHRAVINARHRARRAREKGRVVRSNFWAQLAHKSARSAMALAVLQSNP